MAEQRFMRDGRWMTEDELKKYNSKEVEIESSENVTPLTKAQIIEELNARGIEHNPSDKKEVLSNLLIQSANIIS